MKIKVEIDTTPEELRTFFGMPDVQGLQSDMMDTIREKIQAGMEGYDPFNLLKPFLPESLRTFEGLQKTFWDTTFNSKPKDKKKS